MTVGKTMGLCRKGSWRQFLETLSHYHDFCDFDKRHWELIETDLWCLSQLSIFLFITNISMWSIATWKWFHLTHSAAQVSHPLSNTWYCVSLKGSSAHWDLSVSSQGLLLVHWVDMNRSRHLTVLNGLVHSTQHKKLSCCSSQDLCLDCLEQLSCSVMIPH